LATHALSEPIIPDSIEPFIGYKALRINPHNDRLYSPVYVAEWPQKERAVAQCNRYESHYGMTSPVSHCRCGFYAVRSDLRQGVTLYIVPASSVVVQVALWGKTILYTGGARAQFAYPQQIVAWTCLDEQAERVAESYGLELVRPNYGTDWLVRGQA